MLRSVIILTFISFQLWGKALDYAQIERDFFKEADNQHKAELAYLLAFSPLELNNPTIYYAKYALKLEKDLSPERKCSLRLKLGDFFQDIFSFDQAKAYYNQALKDCKDHRYIKARLAWAKYNKAKEYEAFQDFLSLYDGSSMISEKLGIIWMDLFLHKKFIPLEKKLVGDQSFKKSVQEFLGEEGSITIDKLIQLANAYPSLIDGIGEKLSPKKKSPCDISFLKKIPLEDIFRSQIRECYLSQNKDSKLIIELLSAKSKLGEEEKRILAQSYQEIKSNQNACLTYMSLINRKNVNKHIAAIAVSCTQLKDMEKLFEKKYLQNRTVRSVLAVKLGEQFNLLYFKKLKKYASNEDWNQVMKSTNEKSVFDLALKMATAADEKIVFDKMIQLQDISLIKNIQSKDLKIAALSLGHAPVSIKNICEIHPRHEVKELFYMGMAKSQWRDDYLKCNPDYFRYSEKTLVFYLDGSDKDATLPNYQKLLPKEKFKRVRKELYLVKKISDLKVKEIFNDQSILAQLRQLKQMREEMARHHWLSRILLERANSSLNWKVDMLAQKIAGTNFDNTKIKKFLEKVKDV